MTSDITSLKKKTQNLLDYRYSDKARYMTQRDGRHEGRAGVVADDLADNASSNIARARNSIPTYDRT